jgi:phosphomannomutase
MNVDPSIFKAYDIRGIYPDTINEEVASKIAQGFCHETNPQGEVMVGCDVRIHSPALKDVVIKALNQAGVNTVDVGLITTDMLYFCVGKYGFDGGIQVTASHNPPEWHGFKMVRKGPVPMTLESGISQIRDFVLKDGQLATGDGKNRKTEVTEDYVKYILSWIDQAKIKPMKVVYNPNFGLAGVIFEKIVETGKLPLDLIPLNAKPDGTFPKGRPDPFVPENRPEFVSLVKESGADLGIAWDGDSDRVFFCADGGLFLEPYYLNTLLIKSMLEKYPGGKIIYDVRYTWALEEAIKQSGGEAILVRVGHSYIKEVMRKENALFATESSGHTYYRDYWYSDCGMIPPVQVLEYLSISGKKLAEELKPVMDKYIISGEINQKVNNPEEIMEKVAEKYKDGKQHRMDGISVEYEDYRFNIRTSNTEPLLRLNLEAKSRELMERKRDEVLALIRS